MRLQGIAAEHVDAAWPLIEAHVKRATDESPHFSPEDIREKCKTGDMSLWALVDGGEVVGCLATQIVIYPQIKACWIVAAAANDGARDEWRPLLEEVKEWGRSYGCEIMEAVGRAGWERLFPEARRYAHLEWRL